MKGAPERVVTSISATLLFNAVSELSVKYMIRGALKSACRSDFERFDAESEGNDPYPTSSA